MSIKEFNECVDLYTDRVFRFIVKNLKDEEDSRDVVANSFEILWRNHKEVSFEKCRSYLFTVAYHNMIDWIRKNKRKTLLEEHHQNIPGHQVAFSGTNDLLKKGLERLPEIQKSVVLLRDYEGYSYEEIGTITGLKEPQVKVYIFRARQALKSYLVSVENVI